MENLITFEGQDVALRHQRVLEQFDNYDALLVTALPNVRWLTGFSGSNGFVVLSKDRFLLITDNRYRTSATDEINAAASLAEVIVPDHFDSRLYRSLLGDIERVGFEADNLSWAKHDMISTAVPEVRLVASTGVCEHQRRYKDPGEQRLIEHAASIADEALLAVMPMIKAGSSERTIAAALDSEMNNRGADGPAYETIVASGPNSALPHARPTTRSLVEGDMVIIDVGARVHGYGSDMTRTFVVGGQPTAQQQRWYDAVIAAQQAGVASVGVDVDESSIDSACRSVLADFGFEDAFIHGTGHGLGLEIHEDPVLSPRSLGTLHSGLVITVEPGIYFPGVGGVRIEDAVTVTDLGCTALTKCPKTLNPQSMM